MKNQKRNTLLFYLGGYLLLWVILFEFILPANKVLPRPSIVIQSFPSLISDYNLFPNFISTAAVVYLSLAAAYYTVRFLSYTSMFEKRRTSGFIDSLRWFSNYIPGLLWGILLLFWFPASEYIEFIFAYLAVLTNMISGLFLNPQLVPEEYSLSSRSLTAENPFYRKTIKWKFIQSFLLKKNYTLHLNIWLLLIAFEFIKGGYGMGNIFQKAVLYQDLSAFFSGLVITGLTIYIGSISLKFIENKKTFWN